MKNIIEVKCYKCSSVGSGVWRSEHVKCKICGTSIWIGTPPSYFREETSNGFMHITRNIAMEDI